MFYISLLYVENYSNNNNNKQVYVVIYAMILLRLQCNEYP